MKNHGDTEVEKIHSLSLPSLCLCGLLLMISCLFSGCSTQREITEGMDNVIGFNYQPEVVRHGDEIPTRVLILPVTGDLEENHVEDFLRDFESGVGAPRRFLRYPSSGSNSFPTREVSVAQAKSLGCDGILYLKIVDHRSYPPIRVAVQMVVENLKGEALMESFADYDGRVKTVSNLARRYYQWKFQKTLDPDKSLTILRSDRLFLEFAAFNTARIYLNAFCPPEKNGGAGDQKQNKT